MTWPWVVPWWKTPRRHQTAILVTGNLLSYCWFLIQLHPLVVLVVPFPSFEWNNSKNWSNFIDPWHSETHICLCIFQCSMLMLEVNHWAKVPPFRMKIWGVQKLCPWHFFTNLQIGGKFNTPENIGILYHLQVPAIQFGCGSAKSYLASFFHRGTFLWAASYGWSWAMSPKRHTQRHLPCTLKSFPPKNTSHLEKNNVPSLHHRWLFCHGEIQDKTSPQAQPRTLRSWSCWRKGSRISRVDFCWTNPRNSSTFEFSSHDWIQ